MKQKNKKYKKVPLSSLLEDLSIYPRSSIDGTNVARLLRILEAGEDLDPICVVLSTMQILDGFHRARAMRRFFKKDLNHTIEIEVVDIDDDLEKIKEAWRRNSQHGRQLTTHDQAHSYSLMHDFAGFNREDCAILFKISKDDLLVMIGNRMATYDGLVREQYVAPEGKGKENPNQKAASEESTGNLVILKTCVTHMAGTVLTEAQVKANKRLQGMQQTHLLNQPLLLLENDMINRASEAVMAQVSRLKKVLVEAW